MKTSPRQNLEVVNRMSTKEHCHGCGKLWSEESPECVFNYHKQPSEKGTMCKHGNTKLIDIEYTKEQ